MNQEQRVKFTALAPVTNEKQLVERMNAVISVLGPLTGQHSNKNEKAVQWADLVKNGLVVERLTLEGDVEYDVPSSLPDMSTPPDIAGFAGVAGFNYNNLSWQQPLYKNHSYVEIWRAAGFKKDSEGTVVPTVLSDAVFRMMVVSTACSDTTLPKDVWRYWARNVSKTGVKGQWTSIDGLLLESPEDPGYLLDKISGSIKESDLYKELGDKISDSAAGVKSLQQLTDKSYTVKIDSGDAVAGFGIMTDDTGFSDFIIRSNRFAIAPPQQYDAGGKPIVVQGSFPFIVDMSVPSSPKTLIRNAYIDQAFITSLVTGQLVADKITGQTVNGTHIRGGDIAIGNRFSVDGAGNAIMHNAYVDGVVDATSLTATSSVSIGAVSGAGTYMTRDRIDVRDDAGVVRVRIGRL